jgi:hypothetical protein
MQTRISRDTISRSISEILGTNAEQTRSKFEPNRNNNTTSIAKLQIPEHQRFYVWTEPRWLALIDSIMDNYPLPLIVITQHNINSKIVWYIQDGQQRLTTIQKFMLGEFKWKNKTYLELTEDERCIFLCYKVNIEIIDEPTSEQVADLFERLNNGQSLTDNDKFWNRRESPVVSFILRELKVHKELSEHFKKLTGLNEKSKTRAQLGEVVGAVVAIINNSTQCISTSFNRIGHTLYQDMTPEKKEHVISMFKEYFTLIKNSLSEAGIEKKIKKRYLKLNKMLGIWLCWKLDPIYFMTEQNTPQLKNSMKNWNWFAIELQQGDMIKQLFETLPSTHIQNLGTDSLRARINRLMKNIQISTYIMDDNNSLSTLDSDDSDDSDTDDN